MAYVEVLSITEQIGLLRYQGFLKSLGVDLTYVAADYAKDLGAVPVKQSVHIEAMPDDGLQEAVWAEALSADEDCTVGSRARIPAAGSGDSHCSPLRALMVLCMGSLCAPPRLAAPPTPPSERRFFALRLPC